MAVTITGTEAIAGGAVSADVPGAFGVSPYQAGILSTGWNTSNDVPSAGKTAATFHVDFGVPAPPGGSTFDWLAVIPVNLPPVPNAGETLGSYLVRVRRLLHDLPVPYTPDPTNQQKTQFYSDYDLSAFIMDALFERDLWSGGTRSYQANVPLTIGQDTYTFAQLFPTIGQPVMDVVNVILIYGSTRYVLDNPTFTDLTIKARAQVLYQNRPTMFCRYGANQVVIAPAPGSQYSADFDIVALSTNLVLATDPDPLPYPYTKPIPFYAAYLARINSGRAFDEAETFFGYYVRAMRDIEGARVGEMVNAYAEAAGSRGSRR